MTGIIAGNCPSADEFPSPKGTYLFYMDKRRCTSPSSVKHSSKHSNR